MIPSALLFRHRVVRAATVRHGRQRRAPFRPPKPSGPIAAYTALLNRVVDALNAKITQALHHAGLTITLRQDSPADGGDGLPILPSQRQRALAFVDELARHPIDRRELIGPLDDVAAQTATFSRVQFQRVIHAALGIDVTAGDPHLLARAMEFRTCNVGLIRTLSEDHVARVRKILDDRGVSTRNEDIAENLREATGITKRHAALIARDQVLKYNADVTRARHEDAGITSYTWRTSEDERVRPDHEVLDGQVFRYADPPVVDERTGDTGNPGTYFQCRCTADPIIPGFDDDGASAEASGDDSGEGDSDEASDDDSDTRNDWNPDQPRDEQGRFGSGGSGGAHSHESPRSRSMPDTHVATPNALTATASHADPPQAPPPHEPPSGGGGGHSGGDPNRSEMDPPGGIPGIPPPWHTDNAPRERGTLDESGRTEEARARPIVETLLDHGNHVEILPANKQGGRNPDARVNGKFTEFKTLEVGRPQAIANRINKSKKGDGQARNMVIDVRGLGMSRHEADAGINMQRSCNGKIDYVRVIGDGFDVTYSGFR